jgi:hypothetical protein
MAATPAPETTTQQPPPPGSVKRNGMGTASLVMGVLALVLALLVIFAPLALPIGLIAVILGAIGLARAGRGEADNRGSAMGGLVTGLVAIGVVFIMGITFLSSWVTHQEDLRKFGTCMSNADDDEERAVCIRRLGDRLDEND